MKLGQHPERTPFYGAMLMITAMLIGVAVTAWSHPASGVRAGILVLALIVGVIGFGMTLRDYPRPTKTRSGRG